MPCQQAGSSNGHSPELAVRSGRLPSPGTSPRLCLAGLTCLLQRAAVRSREGKQETAWKLPSAVPGGSSCCKDSGWVLTPVSLICMVSHLPPSLPVPRFGASPCLSTERTSSVFLSAGSLPKAAPCPAPVARTCRVWLASSVFGFVCVPPLCVSQVPVPSPSHILLCSLIDSLDLSRREGKAQPPPGTAGPSGREGSGQA